MEIYLLYKTAFRFLIVLQFSQLRLYIRCSMAIVDQACLAMLCETSMVAERSLLGDGSH